MRLTTEFATAAITITQLSGNTRSSEMLLINTFRGARVRPEKRCHDLTLPFIELIERRFHFHSVRERTKPLGADLVEAATDQPGDLA